MFSFVLLSYVVVFLYLYILPITTSPFLPKVTTIIWSNTIGQTCLFLKHECCNHYCIYSFVFSFSLCIWQSYPHYWLQLFIHPHLCTVFHVINITQSIHPFYCWWRGQVETMMSRDAGNVPVLISGVQAYALLLCIWEWNCWVLGMLMFT